MLERVGGVARERRIAIAGLMLGPSLLVAGLAVEMNPDGIERFIPLSRAWIGGAVGLPILVLAPAVLSLAWSDEAVARLATWLGRAIALAIAVGIVVSLAATLTQLSCVPVTNPTQVVPVGLFLGAVFAGGFIAALAAGRWFASSERPVAALVAAIVVGVLALGADIVALAIAFPGVSCARGPV